MWKKTENKSNISRAFNTIESSSQSSLAAEEVTFSSEPESDAADTPIVACQSSDAEETEPAALAVGQADVAIKRGGEKFYDYYSAYKTIRELARPLNGLSQSAPIPRGLSIQKISIDFTVKEKSYTVEIPEPQKTGDIAPLIAFAIRDLVEKMNNELHILSYLVSSMHNSVQSAFTARVHAPPGEPYDNTNTVQ